MRRLNAAVTALARRLSRLNLEVHVPLYANTFPLATVAKIASGMVRKPTIAITPFDWNWSKDPDNEPPFISDRPWQLFFATASEFKRIHNAGVSFFAVPASVFHPGFVFIGTPAGVNLSKRAQESLKGRFEEALSTKSRTPPGPPPQDEDAFGLTWVSDIPDQAEMLASKVDDFLATRVRPTGDPLVNFWQMRPLTDALGLGFKSDEKATTYKAFIWGGPLSSVAQRDAALPVGNAVRRAYGTVKLRDPDRPSLCVRLPSLIRAFEEDEINQRHALYCCVGYKETRVLQDYYTSGKHVDDKPWDLRWRKYRAMRRTRIPALVEDIREFFCALFDAAVDVPEPPPDGSTGPFDPTDIFQVFMSDYDKYCRTLNPIAQLGTREVYAKCVREHHDKDAFEKLFP